MALRRGSIYHDWWYPCVVDAIYAYPKIKDKRIKSEQESCFTDAIEKAFEDTHKLNNGNDRLKAIELMFFKKMKRTDVADRLYYSESTVREWRRQFVCLVAEKAGFKNVQ